MHASAWIKSDKLCNAFIESLPDIEPPRSGRRRLRPIPCPTSHTLIPGWIKPGSASAFLCLALGSAVGTPKPWSGMVPSTSLLLVGNPGSRSWISRGYGPGFASASLGQGDTQLSDLGLDDIHILIRVTVQKLGQRPTRLSYTLTICHGFAHWHTVPSRLLWSLSWSSLAHVTPGVISGAVILLEILPSHLWLEGLHIGAGMFVRTLVTSPLTPGLRQQHHRCFVHTPISGPHRHLSVRGSVRLRLDHCVTIHSLHPIFSDVIQWTILYQEVFPAIHPLHHQGALGAGGDWPYTYLKLYLVLYPRVVCVSCPGAGGVSAC